MIRFRRTRINRLFCLLLIALAAVTALGGSESEAPKYSKGATAYARALTVAKNRDALEAYEKRNAEITPRAEDVAQANTDNAALLYYQAFLLRPESDEAMHIHRGAALTTQARTYLGRCLPMIEIVEIASRIPGCTWAVWPEGNLSQEALRAQIFRTVNILLVDAEMLAADGHYHVALERCLTVRRLAQHLCNDPELHAYPFQTVVDGQSLHTIEDVLGMMPPNVDILTWFRGQFAVVPGPHLPFAKILQAKVKVQLDAMRTHPNHLRGFRNVAVMKADGKQAREDIQNLADEQFRLRAREGLAHFTDLILRILDTDATCNRKLAQMNGIVDKTMEDDATDPVVKGIISGFNMKGQINVGYTRGTVEHKARVNGTEAAVEIYLILAKTGKLPERLPEHLPKDPFTGQDFEYEITDEGFALHSEGNEFLTHENITFEFRIHK